MITRGPELELGAPAPRRGFEGSSGIACFGGGGRRASADFTRRASSPMALSAAATAGSQSSEGPRRHHAWRSARLSNVRSTRCCSSATSARCRVLIAGIHAPVTRLSKPVASTGVTCRAQARCKLSGTVSMIASRKVKCAEAGISPTDASPASPGCCTARSNVGQPKTDA